jgi:transcriptional regulator with XRE-family HTH domain
MLGNNIKQLRNDSNLTIREISKKMGINHSTYGMYETCRREPDFKTLCKIADYFNVTTDMLLDRTQLSQENNFEYIEVFKKAKKLNITAFELETFINMLVRLKFKK